MNFRVFLRDRATDNPQRLIGEQVADTAALVPSLHVFAVRPANVSGLLAGDYPKWKKRLNR